MLCTGSQNINLQVSDNHLTHQELVIQRRSEWIHYFWRSRRSWFCHRFTIPGLTFHQIISMLLIQFLCLSERATRPHSFAMCPSMPTQLRTAPSRSIKSIQQVSTSFAYAFQYFNIIEAQLFSWSSNAANNAILKKLHYVIYNSHLSFHLWIIFIDHFILYNNLYSAISIIH